MNLESYFKRPQVRVYTDRSVAKPMLQLDRTSDEASQLENILRACAEPLSPDAAGGNHLCFTISVPDYNWPDEKKLVVQFSGFFATIGIGLVNGITNMCVEEVWDAGVFGVNTETAVSKLPYSHKQHNMNHLRMDIVPSVHDLADMLVELGKEKLKSEGKPYKYFSPSQFELSVDGASLVVALNGDQICFGPKVDN